MDLTQLLRSEAHKEYFQRHGVEQTLCDIVERLAAVKPEDPYRFIADIVAPLYKAGSTPDIAPAEKKQPAEPKVVTKRKGATTREAPRKGGGMDVRKSEDVPLWYAQVLKKSELIEQYPVKGCFILRPWAFKIWELTQQWFDGELKKMGVENCYFPMFIPQAYLKQESHHLDDFAPEIAMVTRCGNKVLEEPIAIRPTSETAMYAAFSTWVQSHRDLPLKLNQWCNVVRWEVKSTSPFLRHREYLWQEGHTAFADRASAEKEVLDVLELYAGFYENMMAVPCVRGTKSKAETFPGAEYTLTVEVFIPATGRSLQGGTAHHLGQKFSQIKMFEIDFKDPTDSTGKRTEHAWQNSWGLSTRSIAALIMVHGDDRGLVLPPRLAGYQVIVVPVGLKTTSTDADREHVLSKCTEYCTKLTSAGVRVKVDEGDHNPGWKFNYWEMKGVPLRLEIGPRDIQNGQFVMVKRNHTLESEARKIVGTDTRVVEDVTKTLDEIHDELYSVALVDRDAHLTSVDEWADFSPNLNAGKMLLIPFCGNPACEEMIKNKTKEEAAEVEVMGGLTMGAKSLCVPLEDKYNVNCPTKCLNPDCPNIGKKVDRRTLFGRSY